MKAAELRRSTVNASIGAIAVVAAAVIAAYCGSHTSKPQTGSSASDSNRTVMAPSSTSGPQALSNNSGRQTNKASSTGSQSPAVASNGNVSITYGSAKPSNNK